MISRKFVKSKVRSYDLGIVDGLPGLMGAFSNPTPVGEYSY